MTGGEGMDTGGFSYRVIRDCPDVEREAREVMDMTHKLVSEVRGRMKEAAMAARLNPGEEAAELIRSVRGEINAARQLQRSMAAHMMDMGDQPFKVDDDSPMAG
jgi:hypothetical protein